MIDFLVLIEMLLVIGLIFVAVPAFLGTPLVMAVILIVRAEGDQRASTLAGLVAGTLISLIVVFASVAHAPLNAFSEFRYSFVSVAPETDLISLRPNWFIAAAGVAVGWFYLWWIAGAVEWLAERSNLGLAVSLLVPLGSVGIYNYVVFGFLSVPMASLVMGLLCGTLVRLVLIPSSYRELWRIGSAMEGQLPPNPAAQPDGQRTAVRRPRG
jgi:hypothetical protein